MTLPVEILEKAVQLRNSLRTIYIALYKLQKPSTATEVAQAVGKARAYVSMRLNQLADMGLVKCLKERRAKFYYIEAKNLE